MLVVFSALTLMGATISAEKKTYAKGESIMIDVSGLPQTKHCNPQEVGNKKEARKKNDCSWVGIFYAYDDSSAKNLLAFQYAGMEDSQTFTFDGLDDNAEYEARVFFKNNYKEKGFSNFKVTSQKPKKVEIKTLKERYKTGESISVDVSGIAGNQDDWLGIFYAYDDSNEANLVAKVETHGKKEGILTLPSLEHAGEYEVRVFFKGSFHEEDYYPFVVLEAAGEGKVIINEVMASNAHTIIDPDFSKFSDWIELYNSGSKSIDLSGYKLSDKLSEAKWTIPDGTILDGHSYMLVWADEKDVALLNLHTNFKFKSKGEAVALFDTHGAIVDSFEFGKQQPDISYGRNRATIGYMIATPKKENREIHTSLVLADTPIFSQTGGFYDDSITIELSTHVGDEIYYTLDGSYPTVGSTLYKGAISIDKTTVLRAMSVREGLFPSKRITHTYFINEETTLPVVSITTDEKYLWDDMIGIYTEGKNGAAMVCSKGRANFMQDWKRPANIEYYDTSKRLGFNQEVNIEISGTCSRELAQKSLNIKADDKYGKDSIAYKLFEEKDISEFKSFKLRNSGQDWWKTMFRDAMIQQLIKDDLDIDYQAYTPSILFINGEYWGIHNIREKKNEDYLAANHPGLNPKKVDILYGYSEIKEGSASGYESLIQYIHNHDLSDDTNYNYVATQIDISNYIDYMITQIYIANYDWPYSNIRYWREQKVGAKWRWMMDDQDYGFDIYGDERPRNYGLNHNTLAWSVASNSPNEDNAPWSTFLFRSLLENADFKNAFINRYNALLTTTFASSHVTTLIKRMKAVIVPEMPRHIATWGDAGPDYATMDDWSDKVDVMLNFAEKRPDIAKSHLDQLFEQ